MKKIKLLTITCFITLGTNSFANYGEYEKEAIVLGKGSSFICTGFCRGPSLKNGKRIASDKSKENAQMKCEDKGYDSTVLQGEIYCNYHIYDRNNNGIGEGVYKCHGMFECL